MIAKLKCLLCPPIFILAALLANALSCAAGVSCDGMPYRDDNQIDTKLRLRRIEGIALVTQGVAVPGVCVGLFTESSHKLIAAVRTDGDGHFQMSKIAKGEYRLIAEIDPFGSANARVRIGFRGSSLIRLRVRPRGLDTTSYFEAAK